MISNQAIGDLEPYLQKPNQALYRPDKDTVGLGSRVGKVEAKTKLSLLSQQLKNLQWELYAENNRSVLVIFQSMDAGGKDSTIRKVFGDLNPQGVHVSSFKPPTTEEQQHDFLWRVNRRLPGNGEIVLFNRSHYEDVLVPFVHGQIDEDQWQGRIESIKNFEQHLAANGTVILKFFLHLSKAEQLKRFRERMETPAKRWKITREDYTARYLWGAYQKVYERVIEKTST